MPYRYQCFECDAVLMSEEYVILCPACKEASMEETPLSLEDWFDQQHNCVHCGGFMQASEEWGRELARWTVNTAPWTGPDAGARLCNNCSSDNYHWRAMAERTGP